ncbi:MAG: hypothetical protein FD180_2414, partial [Planctomycetota bacterium]
DAAIARGDGAGALAAFDRAVAEDPAFGRAWAGRGYAKARTGRLPASLEDYGVAIQLEPANLQFRIRRHSTYAGLDLWTEAEEEMSGLLKAQLGNPDFIALLGMDLLHLGRVDEGLELQRAAAAKGGARVNLVWQAQVAKGDWAEVEREIKGVLGSGSVQLGIHLQMVIALVELGRFDDARVAVKAAEARATGNIEPALSRAYLASTPEAGADFDTEGALRAIHSIEGQQLAHVIHAEARALFLAGRDREALDFLATRGRRTAFESLFWMGAAQWRLGMLAEARATLSDAWRLNPYLEAHAKRIAGLGPFAAEIAASLKAEAGPEVDRAGLRRELGTHLFTIAEIETMVRRYQFRRAADEYALLLPTLKSNVRRAEVEARLPEVRGMAGALESLLKAIGTASFVHKFKFGSVELTIQSADAAAFKFTIPKGEGRFPWAYLDVALFCELVQRAEPATEGLLGLGCLAWDAGDRPLAVKLFEEAVKRKAGLRGGVDAFVARRRGVPVPAGGFVLYRGAYATTEEKANLEKGLVLFEGKWVPREDREKLAKGQIQIAGKWVPGDEAELTRRGYRKVDGKWMSREDYDAMRGEWVGATVEETAHATIRTNAGDAFAKELGALIEAAWPEYRKFYGGEEPKFAPGKKMTLYAFKGYEDYRKYCVETKADDHLNAAGFARSDSDVVAGWNKTGDRQQFLQTMVHEGAHLYYFRVAPAARPPSWHAEGMATYFEGFNWDGKSWRFNFLSESRIPFVRNAVAAGKHIPLKDVFSGDALALINSDHNKALLFYAECWSLNLFLTQTDRKEYRDGYLAYRKAVQEGKAATLGEFVKDIGKLETDWKLFVGGL